MHALYSTSFEEHLRQASSRQRYKTAPSLARKWRADLVTAKRRLRALTPRPTAPRYNMPVDIWAQSMEDADPAMRAWVLKGITDGFDTHVVDHPDLPRAKVRNLPMNLGQQLRFTEWTIEQHGTGAGWGPFKEDGSDLPAELSPYRVHPQGMVRKGNHFGVAEEDKAWRPINHLSHPRTGTCTNSQVEPEWSTVEYIQFRDIVGLADFAGPGALIWAVDAKDAFLRVPIKLSCMRFMAFKWLSTLWFFTSLCFGLSSAPRIYTLFADMILWIITHNTLPGHAPTEWCFEGHQLAHHYVDDFFSFVPLRSGISAQAQFDQTIGWFARLGIPTTLKKILKPATRQIILGFLYDTVKQMVFIPQGKRDQYLSAIDRILSLEKVSKQEVLSLIGKLRWASACVFAGPAFVRRLEIEANKVRELHYWVRTGPLKKDLVWWRAQIVRASMGIPFKHILASPADSDIHVLTDASTDIGMGGWCKSSGQWFRHRWSDSPRRDVFQPPTGKAPDIFWKEMCGLVTAAAIWGHQWEGKTITFHCDNMSSVWTIIKKTCTKEREDIMHLVRVLMNLANEHGFHPYVVHIAGKQNITADALSRFFQKMFWEDAEGTSMRARETPSAWACDALVASFWKKPRSRKRKWSEL